MAKKLPANYKPTENEPFMNPRQLAYFQQKLLDWRASLIKESTETLNNLQAEPLDDNDLVDRAVHEADMARELRTRDRERKLIAKIDAALLRIKDGTYGYCEKTNEPIGIKRLEARPIATLTLEAQELHERLEKTKRDDD